MPDVEIANDVGVEFFYELGGSRRMFAFCPYPAVVVTVVCWFVFVLFKTSTARYYNAFFVDL